MQSCLKLFQARRRGSKWHIQRGAQLCQISGYCIESQSDMTAVCYQAIAQQWPKFG
jgi:hypothetical protein